MANLSDLPETLQGLFSLNISTNQHNAYVYSAVEAHEVERELAEYGMSYHTRIVRSRKRGVYYLITLLEDADALDYV